ncbi:MAG: sulfotransferase family 2 domain-containing protein [Rhodothermales bacterium]
MSDLRKLLVFEHIPKTAGSTMHAILWRLYGGKGVYLVTHPRQHRERLDALCRHLQDPANPLCAIIAHTGFGFHKWLPSDYRYVQYTFLRDPVERVFSHYHYQIQRGKLDPSISLESFIREDLGRSCNVQTAFLGGLELRRNLEGITLSPDLYTEELLEQAKANLSRLAVFGLTERFDESLLLFKEVFGWKWTRIFYVRQRVGQRRPAQPDYSDTILRLIRRYNELDLELYSYAQALFPQQQATLMHQGRPTLKTFQKLNAVYGSVFNLTYPYVRPVAHKIRALKEQIET